MNDYLEYRNYQTISRLRDKWLDPPDKDEDDPHLSTLDALAKKVLEDDEDETDDDRGNPENQENNNV